MAKRQKLEQSMLTAVSKKIKKDNKTVDELISKIMKEVEDWVKVHKKDWDDLSAEDRSTLTEPTYLVRKVAEIKYAKEKLRIIILNGLKRSPGNLGEEERMLGLYATLAKFNYSCPYSGTLLIGGEQKIHIDHIIPVTMGGPTDDWNCIPVCENCNESKRDRHLLDWWQENRTPQEEFKLVKIFEYMASKLLDETNEIKYLETEDKTKHLDVITFLNQLFDHIQENKEFIFEIEFKNEQEKLKAIEKKMKELKSTLEKVAKKNNKNTKTDKQHFADMKEMLKFVKSLGVRSYYKIAYTYFAEIQEMRNLGKTEEEIRKFCFDKDDSFNFTLFYEKLIEYKEKFGSFDGVTTDKEIGLIVGDVRQAKKGKGGTKLTQEMIDKLNEIGFNWGKDKEEIVGKWFEPFYEKLIEYKEKFGSFDGVRQDKEIGVRVNSVRQAKKGKGGIKLTQEMIDKLNTIGFVWEVEREDWFTPFYEKLIEYIEKNGSFAGVTTDKEIGQTVSSFRQAKKGKKGGIKLTQEMIDKLNTIGFVWEVEREDWFTLFYEKLIEYKEKFGSFDRVRQNKEIGMRVNAVRQAKKGKGSLKLTQPMIDKLNAIGFPWGREDWFTSFYEKLIEYKEKFGSFDGVTADKEIGQTVSSVRQAKKRKGGIKLIQEMIDKLDEIGFVWVVENDWFTPFYEKLIEYKEKNGSFDGVTNDKEVGQTVNSVRQAKKGKGGIKLIQEMIDKLDEIGFDWGKDKEEIEGAWFEPFYEKLIKYKEKNGSFAGVTKDKDIGKKVASVRMAKKGKVRYKLTQEMIDKLNEIGFPWEARPKKVQEDNLSV